MSQFVSRTRLLTVAGTAFGLAFVFACKSNDVDVTPAIAETPMQTARLASGIEGGTYHDRYVPELDGKLGGWLLAAIPTGGSSENLDLLSTGGVDLALAQADVLASRMAEEPDVFGLLTVLDRSARSACSSRVGWAARSTASTISRETSAIAKR